MKRTLAVALIALGASLAAGPAHAAALPSQPDPSDSFLGSLLSGPEG
jgi:hypothetical protein